MVGGFVDMDAALAVVEEGISSAVAAAMFETSWSGAIVWSGVSRSFGCSSLRFANCVPNQKEYFWKHFFTAVEFIAGWTVRCSSVIVRFIESHDRLFPPPLTLTNTSKLSSIGE
jgi:hypothetical protein